MCRRRWGEVDAPNRSQRHQRAKDAVEQLHARDMKKGHSSRTGDKYEAVIIGRHVIRCGTWQF